MRPASGSGKKYDARPFVDISVFADPDAEMVGVHRQTAGGCNGMLFAAQDVDLPPPNPLIPHDLIFAHD